MQTLIQKDNCALIFIAALFTIAKTCKQPECPSTDEWIKMCIYTMEYYSAIKKQWNNAICSNMDGPRDYHTKWSKSDRERQTPYDISIHLWNLILKKWYNLTGDLSIYLSQYLYLICTSHLLKWLIYFTSRIYPKQIMREADTDICKTIFLFSVIYNFVYLTYMQSLFI